jgi:hypothetical protein
MRKVDYREGFVRRGAGEKGDEGIRKGMARGRGEKVKM